MKLLFQPMQIIMLFFLLAACKTAPFTGRSQFILISPNQETRLGLQAYQEILKKEKKSTNASQAAMVRRVGQRIARAANRADFKWEFNLFESKAANAFCLPGGKIAIYTGLLPITQSEAGLAAVMGHEVAHALAHHGAERISQNMLAKGLLTSANLVLSASGNANQGAIMSALGLGAQVGVLLPFSRAHESEADKIGLILMAKAGYHPKNAVAVWQRMKAKGGSRPPEFLSTHPTNDTRIRRIQRWLPEIVAKHYRPR